MKKKKMKIFLDPKKLSVAEMKRQIQELSKYKQGPKLCKIAMLTDKKIISKSYIR